MPSELIIRNSDRGAFKRCRLSWDWGSKIRQNLIFKGPAPKPLDFGTSIHRGLEVYYNPATWHFDFEIKCDLAILAFVRCQEEQLKSYLKEMNEEALQDELKADFRERDNLGRNMLMHYFSWARTNDAFTPIYTEVEFEVPISGLEGTYAEGAVYQGRIDLIVLDELGRYWIVDHKTTARFDSTEHLELDEQCGSYAWALMEMLGIQVTGIVYNELRKSYPAPPEELKRGGLSKNKTQDAPYEMYVEALEKKFGGIPPDYVEFVEYLKVRENNFFRRTRVHRSVEEMRSLGEQIQLEALDMLDLNIRIYKNPTKFNCKNCMFRIPCIAKQDGSDIKYILSELYKVRSSDASQPNTNTSSTNETEPRRIGDSEVIAVGAQRELPDIRGIGSGKDSSSRIRF